MMVKKLFNTSKSVSAIGQGTGIGGYLAKKASYGNEYIFALKYGIDLGMTFIDTAEDYGNGDAEKVIGEAISCIRDEVFIATKVSPVNLAYDNVLRSVDASLGRLKTDYIDLYQIHWPNPKIPMDETMRAMEQLVAQGKIKYIGVCNFTLRELKEADSILKNNRIASIQVEYNISDRSIENDILPYGERKGITIIAYSPLSRGEIVNRHEKFKCLQEIAYKYKKAVAQIALNWLISHPNVVAIPNATNHNHIRENAKSCDFELSREDFEEINNAFKNEHLHVVPERIRVVSSKNYQTYKTMEEAIENKLGFVPSPVDLAQDISDGEILKPIKVVKSKDTTGNFDYDLVEGRVRYWAWVIAYNVEKSIPVYIIRDN